MKRRFLLFIILDLMISEIICGIPAYPRKITVSTNGQEFFIYLFGDEHNKRAETEDGYTIIQNDQKQWCYAQLNKDSALTVTNWIVGKNETTNKDYQSFLNKTPKHLRNNVKVRREQPNVKRVSKPAIGQRRVLIILMGYQDLPFSKSKSDFDDLFNREGYDEDYAHGSVRDFFLSASYGQLQLESDIYGPYTTTQTMAYYGKNSGMNNGKDINAYSLFEEAITNVKQEADLDLYDGDGDGFVDNVHIIFAGYGEESGAMSDAIWSHEATFYRPYEIQGLKIDRYSCAPELRGNSGGGISRIGAHCHEIGHALGAMDFYDADYEGGGQFRGTGEWDVMAEGSWNNEGVTPADFNPYVKAYNFGWVTPKSLPSGDIEISPSHLSPENYYILKSSEYGDYYLLENRTKKNLGTGLPGEGLLIFHIHYDITNADNDINTTSPQKCYVVCASSKSRKPNSTPASYGEINSDGCPYPGRTNNRDFGQSSTPMAFFWGDEPCGIELNNISQNSNGSILLINNSIGSSYEPLNMQTILFEGFEEDTSVIKGIESSLWEIEENPENTQTFIDKPVAYEGVRSLQLSARDSKVDIIDSLEFRCNPINFGRMRISICVASLSLRFNKPNIVKVGYRAYDNPDWQYAVIQSAENNRWRKSYIDLPDNTEPYFKIIGGVFAGSMIAIDNIEVEQEIISEDSSIKKIPLHTNLHRSIYSLSGTKQDYARKGINIVKEQNGQTNKIFIK